MSDPSFFELFGIPGIPPIAPVPGIPPIPLIPPFAAPPPPALPKQTDDPAAKPFFLPPQNFSDPMRFRGAIRDVLNVTPIIDGNEIFKELETQIAKAESSVLIAFWAFDSLMPMVTNSSKTWKDLLLDAAKKNVLVRVLINDFDPGLQFADHVLHWKSYLVMTAAATAIPLDRFQIVCSHHEAEVPAALVKTQRPDMFAQIAATINLEPDAQTRANIFTLAPGVWDKLKLGPGNTVEEKIKGASYPVCPASHHQKLVIVDGKFAYTGGVNLTPGYVDSHKHDKTPLPWHDAFVKVEGSFAVRDFIRNYVGVWNKERVRMHEFLDKASKALGLKAVSDRIRATTELTEQQVPAVLTSAINPKIPSQIHRTLTVKGTLPTGMPDTVREDILEGYLQAIKQAKEYIYLENQYFRERAIADALVSQHSAKPALKIIFLLPRVTEEHLKGPLDPVSKQGAALQFELLNEMKTSIGANLGLFTLAPNISAAARKKEELIYVHSKLFIVDDKFASIGSANLNPRSFRVDTELDFVWHNAEVSKKLRIDLWNEALGKPSGLSTWKPSQFVSKWSEIAKRNESAKPRSQKGFVIPFEIVNFGPGNPLLTLFT